MTGLFPARASEVRRWTLSASDSPSEGSASVPLTPRSFSAFARPAYAASLNDWSPRPPMSYARAVFLPFESELLLDDEDESPHAVTPSASAADMTPAAAMLVIRRKGRLLQT